MTPSANNIDKVSVGMPLYRYKGKVVNVVDGDTVDVEIDLGFGIVKHERVRLAGVNTPELHSKDAKEKAAATTARQFTADWVAAHAEVFLRTEKEQEKYGRYLAWVEGGDGASLNDELVKSGNAVTYWGGAR